MLVLASLATALYALVNAVGAWLVIRRKPPVAALFMLAAALLMVAAAGLIAMFPYIRVILALGLVLASIASYRNAQAVMGRVILVNHLVRAGIALGIYLLAYMAL